MTVRIAVHPWLQGFPFEKRQPARDVCPTTSNAAGVHSDAGREPQPTSEDTSPHVLCLLGGVRIELGKWLVRGGHSWRRFDARSSAPSFKMQTSRSACGTLPSKPQRSMESWGAGTHALQIDYLGVCYHDKCAEEGANGTGNVQNSI